MMKKTLYTIAATALALAGCQKAEFNAENNGTVNVRFDIELPEATVVTKALAEDPDLQSLYVAVFDANGYKVGFEKATALTKTDTKTYTYSVTLVSTEEPRTLHFIGNCPDAKAEEISNTFGNEMTLLSGIVCEKDQDAYWQKKVLSQGIPSTSEAARDAIGTVDMVRNYTKVAVISTAENFTLEGISVYNTPNKGFLAPYVLSGASAGQFVENYNDKPYNDLVAIYKGYIPDGASLRTCSNSDAFSPVDENKEAKTFVFETPVGVGASPFIIVKGLYKADPQAEGKGEECYYKVNIKDVDGGDYALLRNFCFHIDIRSVAVKGFATPEEAAKSAGSGDICSLSTYENATNISDNYSQLFVSTMAVTVVEESEIKVKYMFVPDHKNAPSTVNNKRRSSSTDNTKPIEVILGEEGEFGAAIASCQVSDTDDADGFREITIHTTGQDGAFKEQQITIIGYGKAADDTFSGKPMKRSINIAVRPRFKLAADCPRYISNKVGAAMPLTLGLEDEIPESIFPVNFTIEALAMSLTPATGENLPVTSGKSISRSGKSAFQFVKNVSYEEYMAGATFEEAGVVYHKINCGFETTKAESTSEIWVASPLFNEAICAFTARELKNFTGVSVSASPLKAGNTAKLSFSIADVTPVTIELDGATINGSTSYTFTPSAAGAQTLNLTTTTFGRQVRATISAEGYAVASAAGKRYATFVQNTVNASNLPVQPCAFSSGNSANFTMNVEGDNVPFEASRVIMLPSIQCEASISRNEATIFRWYDLYSYTVKISNDSEIIYSYSTDGNNYTTVTPSSSGVITINDSRSDSITLRASKTIDGVTYYTTSTIEYNRQSGNNAKVTTGEPGGIYSLVGPVTNTTIEFSGDVTEATAVPMSYTYNSKSASCNTLTVNNIATGTGAYTLIFK